MTEQSNQPLPPIIQSRRRFFLGVSATLACVGLGSTTIGVEAAISSSSSQPNRRLLAVYIPIADVNKRRNIGISIAIVSLGAYMGGGVINRLARYC